MTKITLIALVLGLMPLMSACKKSSPVKGRFEMVHPGSGKKQRIRYKFRKGQLDRYRLTRKTRHSRGRFGSARTSQMEYQREAVELKGGLAIFKVRYSNFKGNRYALMKRLHDQLSGTTGTMAIDGRGRARKFSLHSNDPGVKGLCATLRSHMDHVSLVWPERPLGLGARWTQHIGFSTSKVKVNPESVFSIDYNLKSFEKCPGTKHMCALLDCGLNIKLMGRYKGENRVVTGKGKGTMVFNLDQGWLEKVNMKLTEKLNTGWSVFTTETDFDLKRL